MANAAKTRCTIVIILLLFGLWASRQIGIMTFPPFLDEGVFLHFAEDQATITPLVHAQEGRQFTVWLYALTSAYSGGTFWLARTLTLLLLLPGVAAVIASGKLTAGWHGALLCGLLLLFSPYHQFFDRLAMADSVSAGWVMVGIYFALRLTKRSNLWDAGLCGTALFVAFGFKNTALPYYGVPVAAALTLGWQNGVTWQDRGRWLGAALATLLGLTGVFTLVLWVFGYNYFFLFGHHNRSAGTNLFAQITGNLPGIARTAAGYSGPLILIAGLIAFAYLLAKRRFFFPLVLIAPAAALSASAKQSTRFYEASITILFLLVGIALALAIEHRQRIVQVVTLTAVLLIGIITWLPFTVTANTDPVNLPLYPLTYREYVQGDASGFGLDSVQATLLAQSPAQVFGLLANCQGLRYTTLQDFVVECPRINPNGEDIPVLETLMADNRRDGVYVVLEDSPYTPDSAPGTLVATIEDASGRPTLFIYHLAP